MARSYHTMPSRRINARLISDPATTAGLRGIHRDMDGTIIGGMTPDGRALGNKRRGQGLGWKAAPNVDPANNQRQLGAANLQQRQRLFKDMETAGFGNLTDAMRKRARALGVSDDDFNSAASRIRTNSAYTAPENKPETPPPTRAPRVGKIDGKPASQVLASEHAYWRNPPASDAPSVNADIALGDNVAPPVAPPAAATGAPRAKDPHLTAMQNSVPPAVATPFAPVKPPTQPMGDTAKADTVPSAGWRQATAMPQPKGPLARPAASVNPFSNGWPLRLAATASASAPKVQPVYKAPPVQAAAGPVFQDPARLRQEARQNTAQRVQQANARVKESRRKQSSGIFAPDSVAGAAWRWLQADNL
jgi:hypothetical protein